MFSVLGGLRFFDLGFSNFRLFFRVWGFLGFRVLEFLGLGFFVFLGGLGFRV